MSTVRGNTTGGIPPEQQAIRDKCFHPTGTFIEFKEKDIEQSVPDRFEEQVNQYPDRLAVKTRGEELTYDELNSAANRMAHTLLRHLGEGQEPVGLLLPQGSQVIAGMLAVLKSGKFFVLIDPSLPKARAVQILEDCQARLILSSKSSLDLIGDISGRRARLEIIDHLDEGISNKNPSLDLTPDAIAYLAYTSGSTGQPKGVIDTHRNQLFRTMVRTNHWHTCPEDKWVLPSFGASQMIRTVFNALLNGAGLYPMNVKQEGVTPLVDWLRREHITLAQVTATLFRQLVDSLRGEEEFPNLRLLKVGGQTVTPSDVFTFKKHFSNCIMVHGLSTTETGEVVNYLIDQSTALTEGTLPMGYPIPETEVMLLGDDGSQVEEGGVGEITVRSQYLSPGYWRRPDLTKASFFTDSFDGIRRTYHTGDLGRMLPGGCLIHLGRKDFQLKIRGYRIEVEEIEKVLLSLDFVKEAVVLAREDRPGNLRLVAYLAGQKFPKVSALRRSLIIRLPDYMVPSTFVLLDQLPLLPSGKVNRQALPAPTNSRPHLESAYAPALTPVEEKLTKIWADVLHLEQVGTHDNFLELGGDSLLASQVVSRVIKTFQAELPLRLLFQAPTIAEMAIVIVQSQVESADLVGLEGFLQELESLP